MEHIPHPSNYDKSPCLSVCGHDDQAWEGYRAVAAVLGARDARVIVIDCYLGVDYDELLAGIAAPLAPESVFCSDDIFHDGDELTRLMQPHLTDDRVRGVMYYGPITDFVDAGRLARMRAEVASRTGTVLVYGLAASLVCRGDVLVLADMPRWEIQLRYRAGMPNFKQRNFNEDVLVKYKRGFFVEWRVADRHKVEILGDMDFYLDTTLAGTPKLVTGTAYRAGLREFSRRPFRLIPYFDPGVWGGTWMQEVCGLPDVGKNYAWSFDGVPEENAIGMRFGDVTIETPAMNLVKRHPVALLGAKNHARFGAEFPIRFDFLDTIGGQNLSLQVHPTTEYIKTHFGMTYTQDESYFILDAEEDGGVYLGLREGIDPDAFVGDLERAQREGTSFDADAYVNRFPARKFDHFLIPAGTVHCSSAGTMVLEVSATPYIFTFKLWDWGRLGLDGRPRPIHIENGRRVIDHTRTTRWVAEHLVNRFEVIHDGSDYRETKTGLHELEFIETRLFETSGATLHDTADGVNVLNLVDGREAVIESPSDAFEPFVVHYAETFIVPAAVGAYRIRPTVDGEQIRVLKAYVRSW